MKCIEDEIPFEVPEGWAWCRLECICPYGETESVDSSEIDDDSWILDLEDIEKETGRIVYFATKGERKAKSNKHRFFAGQLLYSKLRPYLNKVVIAPRDGFCTSEILPLKLYGSISPEYMQYFLMSDTFLAYVNLISYGLKMPRLGTNDGKNAVIALPPLGEQTRIVEKCHNAFEKIYTLQSDIDVLENVINLIKSKILDLAIQGKLVPQDSNDEPASVLLERIRAEKEVLIKQGKFKRDKKESIIYKGDDNSYYEKFANGEKKNITDEIPFNLPETWQWCRLKHIGNIIGGGTPKTAISDYWDGDIPWITPADLSGYDDIFISSGARNISVIGLNKSSAQLLPKGTVLFSSRAPIGYTAIASNEISTNQGFKSFVPATSEITSKYIYYCLKARYDDIVMRASGTTFKEISGSEMAETLIPLPPQNDQERITEYIVYLNDYISSIEANLS